MSWSTRVALGLSLLAPLILVGPGCKSKRKKRPRKLAKQGDEDSRVRDSYEYTMVPDVGPVPEGVNPQLWADVAYFPASVEELGLLPRAYSLLSWLESNINRFDSTCKEVLDSIDRYYMVKLVDDPEAPQTLVFYGKIDRLLVERCAHSMYTALGAKERWDVEQDGITTVFGGGEALHVLEWAKRGDEVVVVYDTHTDLIHGFFEADATLERDAAFVDLLVGLEPDDVYAVTAGRRDFGSVLTTIPSTGYRGTFGFDPKHGLLGEAWLRYESAEEAERAAAGLAALIKEFNDVEVGVLVSDGVDGNRVGLHIEPDWSFFAEPETKLRPVLDIIARRSEAAGLEVFDVEALVGLAAQAGADLPNVADEDSQAPNP